MELILEKETKDYVIKRSDGTYQQHNPIRFKQPVCDRNCPKRTVTCKFDGSCNKYSEYKLKTAEGKKKAFDKDYQIIDYYKSRGAKI